MTDKVIRLFKMLLAIQANPGISAKELADKCETTDRTIYRDLRTLDLTEREIDPYYLVPRDQRFYLIGYCRAKREIRTFRISRFRHVELTGNLFDKGDFSIAQLLLDWTMYNSSSPDTNSTMATSFTTNRTIPQM